jgi:hypothetical protein
MAFSFWLFSLLVFVAYSYLGSGVLSLSFPAFTTAWFIFLSSRFVRLDTLPFWTPLLVCRKLVAHFIRGSLRHWDVGIDGDSISFGGILQPALAGALFRID